MSRPLIQIPEYALNAFRQLIVDLSDGLTEEGPDWSEEGVDNLRRRVANAVPKDMLPDWLHRYRDPSIVRSV